MGLDAELQMRVLESLNVPVSEAEARSRRARILLKGLGALLGLAYVFIMEQEASGSLWRHPLTLVGLLGIPALLTVRRLVVEYRVARARPAAPVPLDVLVWELKWSSLCPQCHTLVRGQAERCPTCNTMTPRAVRETRVAGGVLTIILGLVIFGVYRIMTSP